MHQERLNARAQQTLSWNSPTPLPTVRLAGTTEPTARQDGPRIRAEWETRDTMNNRLWSDLMQTPAKQVTPEMVAAHPTGGIWPMTPTESRMDTRQWNRGPQYFPDPATGQRPGLPQTSLIGGSWGADYNAEGVQAVREARAVVKETKQFYGDEVAARINDRVFQPQWAVPAIITPIDSLRPNRDDYRRNYRVD
jgi:hypothetical protein